MHDWTFISAHVDWHARRIELKFRDRSSEEVALVAQQFADFHIPRRDEWGPSQSVNEISGPSPSTDGNQRVAIEMQSGDVIEIEAATFVLPRGAS